MSNAATSKSKKTTKAARLTKTKRATAKRATNSTWFIKVRGSYLPNSWQGWLTYIPFIAYLITVMVVVIQQDSGWINKLMVIFVQYVAAAIVMTWVAANHS